ncbi:hypothetical protein NQZ79_g2513 [Umbelopsis isabellina]|nr:hypothetical protein NQZ79_g2513 [Umbelopsis isabellina]
MVASLLQITSVGRVSGYFLRLLGRTKATMESCQPICSLSTISLSPFSAHRLCHAIVDANKQANALDAADLPLPKRRRPGEMGPSRQAKKIGRDDALLAVEQAFSLR